MSKKADKKADKKAASVKPESDKLDTTTPEEKGTEKNEPKMLGAVVAGMKESLLKETGGVRRLSPEARKSRALKALIGAMQTRAWVDNMDGTYTLNAVRVDTVTEDFAVNIHDGDKAYALQLGKGAIRELDAYMKLR